jgi:serine/threonine protein phosphatase PrpC
LDVDPDPERLGTPPGPPTGTIVTRKLVVPQPAQAWATAPCLECGGVVDGDGYCQTCGTKAPRPRDHFEQAPAPWVGGVSDRGIAHHRNEDAMALWAAAAPEERAVLVVCDGVSTSTDSDAASLAASQRAAALLQVSQPVGLGLPGSRQAALAAVLTDATAAANDAVIASSTDNDSPASCTIAAAVIVDGSIHYATVGDSRVYWIGATERRQLSRDDSFAQELMTQGMARNDAETHEQAHAITKWLGRDAHDIVPAIGSWSLVEDGWLVVCSDGLWNYASTATDLGSQLDAASAHGGDAVAVARRLVAWANSRGGKDNVTVALAKCRASLPTTQSIV